MQSAGKHSFLHEPGRPRLDPFVVEPVESELIGCGRIIGHAQYLVSETGPDSHLFTDRRIVFDQVRFRKMAEGLVCKNASQAWIEEDMIRSSLHGLCF